MTITSPLPIETSIAAKLREKALEYIESNDLDYAAVGAKLEVAPQTAQLMLSRPRWDMHVALMVADRLGISLTIT